MDLPSTLGGWVGLIAAVTMVMGAWSGFFITIAKRYIDQTVGNVVRESIDAAMQPIRLELVTMNGELTRVRLIEQKIENGLTSEVNRIGSVVDDIVRHMMWNGEERRQ